MGDDATQQKIFTLLDVLATSVAGFASDVADHRKETAEHRKETLAGFERVERRLANMETRVGA